MKQPSPQLEELRYGFKWGPVTVERLISHKGGVLLGLTTNGVMRQVWISPTGRSVRVSDPIKTNRPILHAESEKP